MIGKMVSLQWQYDLLEPDNGKSSRTSLIILQICMDVPNSGNWTCCRVGGKSNIQDFTLAAEACLPIIVAVLAEIKRNNYPKSSFLNIDVPTDVSNHKVNLKVQMHEGHIIFS